jgi:hypothetical protein
VENNNNAAPQQVNAPSRTLISSATTHLHTSDASNNNSNVPGFFIISPAAIAINGVEVKSHVETDGDTQITVSRILKSVILYINLY